MWSRKGDGRGGCWGPRLTPLFPQPPASVFKCFAVAAFPPLSAFHDLGFSSFPLCPTLGFARFGVSGPGRSWAGVRIRMLMEERWLPVGEIAVAHLGVNPDMIHNWIICKRLPAPDHGAFGISLLRGLTPGSARAEVHGPNRAADAPALFPPTARRRGGGAIKWFLRASQPSPCKSLD